MDGPMLLPNQVVPLQEILNDRTGAERSALLLETPGGMVSTFAYDQEQQVEAHMTPHPVVLYLLSGSVDLQIDNQVKALSAGDICLIPAHCMRSLKGGNAFQFLLIMLKDPKQSPSSSVNKHQAG